MAKHIALGIKGEKLALQFLIEAKYEIITTNYKAEGYEVDIIAKQNNILVFIEVKTRSTDLYGPPDDGVTAKKEEHISEAADIFMQTYDDFIDIRFDIISIILKDNKSKIFHIEDAFFPRDF